MQTGHALRRWLPTEESKKLMKLYDHSFECILRVYDAAAYAGAQQLESHKEEP